MTIYHKFRQIRIEKAIYLRIKSYCISHELKISTFFEHVLTWFLSQLDRGNMITYRASRQEGYLMTIRLRQIFADVISLEAQKEKISDARVIFTALTLYLDSHIIQ